MTRRCSASAWTCGNASYKVTASLMLRKLGSYPRRNGLAVALQELGRIERTLFTLEWLRSVELRRRVQAGLNWRQSDRVPPGGHRPLRALVATRAQRPA